MPSVLLVIEFGNFPRPVCAGRVVYPRIMQAVPVVVIAVHLQGACSPAIGGVPCRGLWVAFWEAGGSVVLAAAVAGLVRC